MKSSVLGRWFVSVKVRGLDSGWKAYDEDELELLLLEDDEDDELLLEDDELLDDDDDEDDDEDELELLLLEELLELPHQGLWFEGKDNGVCMV